MQAKTGHLQGVERRRDLYIFVSAKQSPFYSEVTKADFSDRGQKRRAMAFLSSLSVNMRDVHLTLPAFLLPSRSLSDPTTTFTFSSAELVPLLDLLMQPR